MPSRKVQILIALLAILGLGGALRFYGLADQGLLFWDEGGYLSEALFLYNGLHDLDSLVTGQANGLLPRYGKPTHAALIALMMGLMGKQDYAGLLVSAFLGTSCILVIFELARRMFNLKVALLGSLTLAVLPYHVMYSRQALPDANSTLFFYLSVLSYYCSLTSTRRPRALASLGVGGLFFGIAVTCNYRLYPLLAIPCLFDLTVCGAPLLRSGVRRLLARGPELTLGGRSAGWLDGAVICCMRQAVLVGASLIPLLLWEGAFHALGWYARVRNLGPPVVRSLFQQLRYLVSIITQREYAGADLAFYARSLLGYAGPILFLLLLLGLVLLATQRTKRVEAWLLLAAVLAPIVFFSLIVDGAAPRFICTVLPAASVVVARAAEVMHGRVEELLAPDGGPRRVYLDWAATVLLPSLIVVSGLVGSWPMLSVKSGNRQAALFLKERGVYRYLTSQPAIARFYAPSMKDIELIPRHGLALPLTLYDRGFEHVVIDEQAYFCASATLFSQELLARIESELQPVYIATDMHKLYPQFFLEQDPCSASFQERMDLYGKLRKDRGAPEVRVYELPQDFVWSLLSLCIDLRIAAEPNQLGQGWYDVEEDGDNRWRWMAREGWLLLGVEDGKDTLEITGNAVTGRFEEEGVLLQVFVHDRLVGEEWLEEGAFTAAFEVPGEALQDEVATVRLQLSETFTPEGELRELGIIVHSICFR